MELFSEKFKEATIKAMKSHKPFLAVLHLRSDNSLLKEYRNRDDAEIIIVTLRNREQLQSQIEEKVLEIIKQI